MFTRLVKPYATRAIFTWMVLAILSLSLAAPVSAAEANPVSLAVTKPTLAFSDIKPDQSVTVEGRNLPANTTFMVRVAPFYTFFRDYETLPSVKSDANGMVKFSITLPSVVKGVEWVTVRLDGGGKAAFNAFVNVKGGAGKPTAVPTAPGTTATPAPATGKCSIVSVTPGMVTTRLDFDAVWTVKNTSSETWDMGSVDYKYVSGTKLQKRNDVYDMSTSVKSGETVKIIVDMLGPSSTGWYSTTWALVQGSKTLCSLPMNLRVK